MNMRLMMTMELLINQSWWRKNIHMRPFQTIIGHLQKQCDESLYDLRPNRGASHLSSCSNRNKTSPWQQWPDSVTTNASANYGSLRPYTASFHHISSILNYEFCLLTPHAAEDRGPCMPFESWVFCFNFVQNVSLCIHPSHSVWHQAIRLRPFYQVCSANLICYCSQIHMRWWDCQWPLGLSNTHQSSKCHTHP